MGSEPEAQYLVPALLLTLLSSWANSFSFLGFNFPIYPKKVWVRDSQSMALMTKCTSRTRFLLPIGIGVGMGV